MKRSTIPGAFLGAIGIFTIWTVIGTAQQTDATTTTVTAATGTITQLNYGSDGGIQGFLIGTNILLAFPSNICGGVETLGVVGNSVTYSGTAFTTTSGFESVNVTSFTNNTTKATYTPPASTSTTYGPTSGTVKQLNYAGDGSIDGFVFTPSGGASIFVSTNSRASATLTPLLTVGATVSVTGTTSASMSACTSNSALEAVNASSLTIGTQTIVIAGGNGGNGGGGNNGPGGPGGPGGGHR